YHVLAEKPLTLDPRECWELCQLAEKQQRQLMVDHTYLFHPAIERGQAVVEGGELGDLRYGYACRTHLGPVRQDVDVLWDLAIHDVAIFNTWLGQKPVSVQALGRVWLQGENPRWGEPQVERKPYPVTPSSLSDLVWVTLTYSNGFQAYIHLCWLNPDKQRRLAVVGSRGCLIFDEMSAKSPLTLMQGELEVQGNKFMPVNQRRQVLQVETGEPLKRVCDRFVRCVHSNTPCMISSGWVGTELVEILAALTESLNQGGKLVFLDKNQ
ncbi:MAG: Gfo/Idh/MocA family oxidoreductase, partial [Fischerella sp.]|nr:Gfo/Idh/MocA family oxidoreductase [Fischerella sp.]